MTSTLTAFLKTRTERASSQKETIDRKNLVKILEGARAIEEDRAIVEVHNQKKRLSRTSTLRPLRHSKQLLRPYLQLLRTTSRETQRPLKMP